MGPRAGIAEIRLPAVQPGSSIMPGKVNPSVAEMVNQVCFQVIGCDTVICMAAEAGQLELNVMMPVIAWNALHASTILRESMNALRSRCVDGIEADVERMLARFPLLQARVGQEAGTLSGGEQQMLAVARALMSRPKLLLMDEPSLGLAPLVVAEIFRIIGELHREGVSIFLVEQNAHLALQVAHHFYLMVQGRVTFSGDPGTLAEDEVIRRAYLGAG